MKKLMMALFLTLFLLTGCTKFYDSLTIEPAELSEIDKYFYENINKNDVNFITNESDNSFYVLLSGQPFGNIKDIKTSSEDKTITLDIQSEANDAKVIEYHLYNLKLDQKYDEIIVLINGEKTEFDTQIKM